MRLSNTVGCTLCHCSDMKTPVPRSMAYEGKLCKFCKQSYPFSSFILSSAVEVLALTVLNLSSNFVIFCFACDFLANFNIQFLWKKSEHPLDCTVLGELGLSAAISAISGQGRAAETISTIHFLYIRFLQAGLKKRVKGGNGARNG